MKLCEMYR